jgi:CheY-like chemotaxis protein
MNRRVLFVEDDALLRTIYRRQTQAAFDVDVVEGAEPALAAIAQADYAVIVTDLSMPGLDGIELARRARQLAPRSLLVVLSAHTDGKIEPADAELLLAILEKPCPRERLLSTLEEGVARHHAATGAVPAVP